MVLSCVLSHSYSSWYTQDVLSFCVHNVDVAKYYPRAGPVPGILVLEASVPGPNFLASFPGSYAPEREHCIFSRSVPEQESLGTRLKLALTRLF